MNIKTFLLLFSSIMLFSCCAANVEKTTEDPKGYPTFQEVAVFYFVPGTIKLVDKDLDDPYAKLDSSAQYRIHGYACEADKGSELEMLAIAERRATKIRVLLVEKGFPEDNLSITAFDKSTDCKAVIIKIDN